MKENNRNLTVGYDIGIGSVGWAIMDNDNNSLVEQGVVLFDEAGQANERRINRSARRGTRRRKWRLKQMEDAFVDFDILTREELNKPGFKSFSANKDVKLDNNNENDQFLDESLEVVDWQKYPTIYHLRKHALNNEVSPRELFLSLYNICKTRGHFLLDGKVNFDDGENLDVDVIVENFFETIEANFNLTLGEDSKQEVHRVLRSIADKDKSSSGLDKKIVTGDELTLLEFLFQCIKGGQLKSAHAKLLDMENPFFFREGELESAISIDNFIKDESTIPKGYEKLIEDLIGIYNSINTYQQLNNKYFAQKLNYPCEVDVFNNDLFLYLKDLIVEFNSTRTYESDDEYTNDIIDYINGKLEEDGRFKLEAGIKVDNDFLEKEFLKRVYKRDKSKKVEVKKIKDIDASCAVDAVKNSTFHNYPNGLYRKEVSQILQSNRKWIEKVTDFEEFKKAVLAVVSARIPYYMGPLAKNGEYSKTSWVKYGETNVPLKYSYEYMRDSGYFDEEESIKVWKDSMISRCSYLPDHPALPKESFLVQLYNILNETNNFDSEKQLTEENKYKIIDECFLKNPGQTIKCEDVRELIPTIEVFGTKSGKYENYQNKFTLYHDIVSIVPELKITSIKDALFDLDKENNKIDIIEDIILNCNLLEDNKNKLSYFTKKYQNTFTEEQIKDLSRLNTTKISSVSRALLVEENLISNDQEQKTMIEWLLTTGKEQMGILAESNLKVDKYTSLIEKNNGNLDINLIFESGKDKARMPVSRTVVKALNVCMKVHNEIVKLYGAPSKVVLETAKDFKDFTEETVKCQHRANNNIALFDKLAKKKVFKEITIKTSEFKNEVEKYKDDKKLQRKLELYIRQDGIDLISLKPIDLNDLINNPFNYELGHIVPRVCGEHSGDNIILISKESNSIQKDRVPIKYFQENNLDNLQKYKDIVNRLYKNQMISANKYERLMLEDSEVEGFISRNLNDTRYTIREFQALLKAWHDYREEKVVVKPIKAYLNRYYRNAFQLYKNRDEGAQHHAHDAALAIVIDKLNDKDLRSETSKQIIRNKYKNTGTGRLDDTIRSRAQEENLLDFVEEVKAVVPLYNHLVNKKKTGELFQATILPKLSMQNDYENDPATFKKIYKLYFNDKNDDGNLEKLFDVISEKEYIEHKNEIERKIPGLSTTKNFSSFKPYAIDFYEYLDKKGNPALAFVIVPRIMFKNGKLNFEEYKTLVLLQNPKIKSFDELKFKFRMYKYDLAISLGELIQIKGGTINRQILEIGDINITSYKSLERIKNILKKEIQDEFDLEQSETIFYINPKDEMYSKAYQFVLGKIRELDLYNDKLLESLTKNLSIRDLVSFCANAILYKEQYNEYRYNKEGRCRKAIKDVNICKIKPQILGIRRSYDENGKLHLSGPRNIDKTINGNKNYKAYKKIKNEKFSLD